MRRRITRTLLVAVAAACVSTQSGCKWEQDSPLQPFVTLQEIDQTAQPTTSQLGVLVAVLASGGDAVSFEVQGGTIDGQSTTECSVLTGGSGAFVVTIFPSNTEATLTATLGNTVDGGSNACGGLAFQTLGTSSTLVVALGRAPAPPSESEAGTDATVEGNGDAKAGGDGDEDAGTADTATDGKASADAADGGDAQ
jgi:hypothetical protein